MIFQISIHYMYMNYDNACQAMCALVNEIRLKRGRVMLH